MRSLNGKVTGNTLTADEWNDQPTELQNMIVDMGMTLSAVDLDQVGKAVTAYAASADFYVDTGAADAYAVDPIGGKQALDAVVGLLAVHDGLLVRFRPTNANTGASTIDVNGIGVKDLERESGAALSAGDIVTTRDAICRYDAATDDFFILDSNLSSSGAIIHSGAKARRTTDVTHLSATDLEVVFTSTIYDDGVWRPSEDTDFVVPTGVTRVIFTACIEYDPLAQSDLLHAEVFKNGATFDGAAKVQSRFGTDNVVFNLSCIDNCVATDTYSVNVRNDTSEGNQVIAGTGNHVWMAIAALQKS